MAKPAAQANSNSPRQDSPLKTTVDGGIKSLISNPTNFTYNKFNPRHVHHAGNAKEAKQILSEENSLSGARSNPMLNMIEPVAIKRKFEPLLNKLFAFSSRAAREKEFSSHIKTISDPEEKNELKKEFMKRESVAVQQKSAKMTVNDFTVVKVIGNGFLKIGHGGFGVVQLVKEKATNEIYAMKLLTKSKTIERQQTSHVHTERNILSIASESCEWIVRLFYSFQDSEYLYFVLEYMAGGDFLALLIKLDIIPEESARFYFAEMVLAIEEVHKLGMIHRDIKPDNFLLDHRGHIKLADFGLAWDSNKDKKIVKEAAVLPSVDESLESTPVSRKHQAYSVVGTNNYVAPEVLKGLGYDKSCDWWSVGIILFEMIYGYPPFSSSKGKITRTKIVHWRKFLEYPQDHPVSAELTNLMSKLICDAPDRLGGESILGENLDIASKMVMKGDAEDIKQHPWFLVFDWNEVHDSVAPYVPQLNDKGDTSHFEEVDMELVKPILASEPYVATAGVANPFEGFTYIPASILAPKKG